jgi:hypothetical protein
MFTGTSVGASMACCLSAEDFVKAMAQVRRSVSNADMKRYEKMRVEFQSKI